MQQGIVARCEACLKRQKVGRKRKRGKGGRADAGEYKKRRFGEDSSAEEEELDMHEAGVMKACDIS